MNGCARWNAVSKHATWGNRREGLDGGFDAGDVVRLVEGRERNEGAQLRERCVVDPDRLGVIRPSVHDAVADRGDRGIVARLLKPVENGAHRRRVIDARERPVETELGRFA